MKVASFFAGVGGIDTGFEQAGFNVIWANEFDKNAAKTYLENFDSALCTKDINNVTAEEIPDFDVMAAGFPCQAFSVAGYRQGFNDEKGRGNLFFQLERIFLAKQPTAIFLENVKNLVGHDHGNTFKVIHQHLVDAGYHVKHKVLNACEYGNLPQNRERIYIVAFKNEATANLFNFPGKIDLTNKLSDCISYNSKQDDKYYYTPEGCHFYDMLTDAMRTSETLYQWRRKYVRENKSNLCPTLTANMGTGGHNVPLVKTAHGIRKLTPQECFNIMGFPKGYILPKGMAQSHLYKQAGNSVVVPVIRRIADAMKKALDGIETPAEESSQTKLPLD